MSIIAGRGSGELREGVVSVRYERSWSKGKISENETAGVVEKARGSRRWGGGGGGRLYRGVSIHTRSEGVLVLVRAGRVVDPVLGEPLSVSMRLRLRCTKEPV